MKLDKFEYFFILLIASVKLIIIIIIIIDFIFLSDRISIANLVHLHRESIVKLRSRSRSCEGQVRVRKVKETKDLDLSYTLFLVFTTLHPPTQTFFLAFKGSIQVRWTQNGFV